MEQQVKIIFIVCEVCALLGVVLFVFLSDMGEYLNQIIVVLFAVYAVAMQREQQAIEWED